MGKRFIWLKGIFTSIKKLVMISLSLNTGNGVNKHEKQEDRALLVNKILKINLKQFPLNWSEYEYATCTNI